MADRGRLTANLAAVGLLLALCAGFLVWQRPWATPDPAPTGSSIPADARSLLVEQFHEMTAADTRAEFVAALGTSAEAHATGREIWDARRALKVEDVGYSYARGGEAADHADGTTSAVVEVSWRGGASDVRFRMRPRSRGFDVVSALNVGRDPLPVWLAGKVRASRSSGATVITVDGGVRNVDVPPLARKASAQVARLVPNGRGRLTVLVPRQEATTAAVLGRRPSEIAQVAAISTALGQRNGNAAIVLNPTLFAEMDARARQIVMTHEATHVLTGVVGHKIELWVAEGFADYVALHDDRAPLAVSAGQILRQVKADGAPKKLPTAKDFDESTHGLGAVYESAWMVFRMLGEQFGDAPVRSFYDDVLGGVPVATATLNRFGLTLPLLTAEWRAYLTKSVSTMS